MDEPLVDIIEIYRDDGGDSQQWRFRLKSANGEIIASGEAYSSRADCEAIALQLAPDADLRRL